MYQLEVKASLIAAAFPPSKGWTVYVDIDSMERCRGGKHPVGKFGRVMEAEKRLSALGVVVGSHPDFGRADVVASHPLHGVVVVEVEGRSSRQPEQALYSALGQVILIMRPDKQHISYALAMPDDTRWERQLRKIPTHLREQLRLRLYLVSQASVRECE